MAKTVRTSGSLRGGKGSGGVKFPPHQDHKPAPSPAPAAKTTTTSRSPLIMTGKAGGGAKY